MRVVWLGIQRDRQIPVAVGAEPGQQILVVGRPRYLDGSARSVQ
jgi:hypothetical protein